MEKKYWLKAGATFLALISWFIAFEIVALDLIENLWINFSAISILILIGVVLIGYAIDNQL